MIFCNFQLKDKIQKNDRKKWIYHYSRSTASVRMIDSMGCTKFTKPYVNTMIKIYYYHPFWVFTTTKGISP